MIWLARHLLILGAVLCFAPVAAQAAADGCAEELVSEGNGLVPIATTDDAGALVGKWVASQDPSNNSGLHCHIMTIHFESGPNEYAVTVDTRTPAGWSLQFCKGLRDGDKLAVTCDVVAQDMPYNDDNFSLTLNGPLLVGRNVDDAGVFGDVRFCRN